MQPQPRLIHLYDLQQRRIACGAPGQSNSTKHRGGVNCAACLDRIAKGRALADADRAASSWH
jgi:hypothetical protein